MGRLASEARSEAKPSEVGKVASEQRIATSEARSEAKPSEVGKVG
jgi:hypothetical protein